MSDSAFHDASLVAAFAAYDQVCPKEKGVGREFITLLDDADGPFVRERLIGHYTASAWLVDAAGKRLLMTHHRKLDRWLQLGGHADGDRDLAAVALREAEEESGLVDLVVSPEIFDLDRHWIPERSDVPGHWHYDARYVVRATGSEDFVASDESHALAWRDIAGLLQDPAMDPSIMRMARKWARRRDSVDA